MTRIGGVLLLAAVALAGCTSGKPFVREVAPVQKPVNELCVQKNEAVIVAGFHDGLLQALSRHSIKALVYTDDRPSDNCPIYITYTANNSWDLRKYLGAFSLQVFEQGQEIGSMRYSARNAGKDPAKYNAPVDTLTPMVAQLFPLR